MTHRSGPVAERFASHIASVEEASLSPLAVRSYGGAGRLRPDDEDCSLRTPFQRDRDRIVHCKAFRRLKQKTQVFIAPQGDHFRTRLTHTLEVSGIARGVARALRLNEDLAEAIGARPRPRARAVRPHRRGGDRPRAAPLRPPASGTTSTRCGSSTCSSTTAAA